MSTLAQPTGPKADQSSGGTGVRARPLPKTQPSADGLRRLPGVVLFAAGKHTPLELGPDLGTLRQGQQREFPPDYLGRVVRNFAALKADAEFHHEPPAVIGHERVQAKLAEILSGDDTYQKVFADAKATSGGGPGRTDQPAAGWWDNLRLDPDGRMVADLERIPPSVGDMIDRGELRFPSVEFKESAIRADGTPVGPFLFRVALLGGTPPGCKTIPPLGQAHFADLPDGVVAFADAVPADAGDTTPKPSLKTLRLHHPTVSEKTMAMLTKSQIESLFEDANANAEGGAAGGDAHAQLVAAYVKAGLGDETSAAQMTDDQLRTALSAAGVTAMADSNPTDAAPKPKPPAEPPAPKPNPAPKPAPGPAPSAELAAFADDLRAELRAEFAGQADAIRKAADAALASQKAREDEQHAAFADSFIDSQKQIALGNGRTGARITPAMDDPSVPVNFRKFFKSLPADGTYCFADADGSEKAMSLRDAFRELVKLMTIRDYGEKVFADRQGQNPDAVTPERKKELLASYGPLGRMAIADMEKSVARN